TELLTIPCNQGFVRTVAFSPDGQWIATSSLRHGSVKLWRADRGEVVKTLAEHNTDEGVWDAFSPAGTRSASVSGSLCRPNLLRVHQVATGEEIWRVQVSTGRNASLAFSPDGREIVVACGMTGIGADAGGKRAGWMKSYDVESRQERTSLETEGGDAF